MRKYTIDITESQVIELLNKYYLNTDDVGRLFIAFDDLVKKRPDAKIMMETKQGCLECKISEITIYEDIYGNIVLDSE